MAVVITTGEIPRGPAWVEKTCNMQGCDKDLNINYLKQIEGEIWSPELQALATYAQHFPRVGIFTADYSIRRGFLCPINSNHSRSRESIVSAADGSNEPQLQEARQAAWMRSYKTETRKAFFTAS